MRRIALVMLCAAALLPAEQYSLVPTPSLGPASEGTVTSYKLAPGKFYPGTPHNYSVYVPAQY